MPTMALSGEFGVFVAFEDGEVEMVFYCQQARDNYCRGAGKSTGDGRKVAKSAPPKGNTAMYAVQCVDFGTENKWNFIEENVTNDTSACSCECAHDDGYPHGLASRESFLDADDGKHAETEGVKKEPCVVAAYDVFLQAPHEKKGKKGDAKIDGVLHPKDGHAEHHVA